MGLLNRTGHETFSDQNNDQKSVRAYTTPNIGKISGEVTPVTFLTPTCEHVAMIDRQIGNADGAKSRRNRISPAIQIQLCN